MTCSLRMESFVDYIRQYLTEMQEIINNIDIDSINRLIDLIIEVRKRHGRVFFLGIGGGAGNASHAVCDFRKLIGVEAYSPVDNVSELTAQINDNGWESALVNWLQESRINKKDLIFVFSVGGGNLTHNISPNLVYALQYAHNLDIAIAGIVGRDGGFTAKVAKACVIVPIVNTNTVTPHTESFQAAIWHLIVSHPQVQITSTKWESVIEQS